MMRQFMQETRLRPFWLALSSVSMLLVANFSDAVAGSDRIQVARAVGMGNVVLETRLKLNPRMQTRPSWSWAAITAMIKDATGRPAPPQCSLLRDYFQKDCCAAPGQCTVDFGLARFQSYLSTNGIAVKRLEVRDWKPLDFYNHIKKTGKPVIAKIQPQVPESPTGTFVLITGAIHTTLLAIMFEYYDPVRGADWIEDIDFYRLLETPAVLLVE